VRAGDVHTSFCVSGSDFGFHDIAGCAAFLDKVIASPTAELAEQRTPQAVSVVRMASAVGSDAAEQMLPASSNTGEGRAAVHAQHDSDSIR
jgi:hypothetical protein